jgi:hypothetical protein
MGPLWKSSVLEDNVPSKRYQTYYCILKVPLDYQARVPGLMPVEVSWSVFQGNIEQVLRLSPCRIV